MKFHHIGIATENIDSLLEKIRKYFNIKNITDIIYDELQDANLCMITLEDGTKLELISGNVVNNIVNKKRYLYHTCYSTDNLDKTIKDLLNDGAILVSDAKEAILFDKKRVAFLMWDLGLIELVEE